MHNSCFPTKYITYYSLIWANVFFISHSSPSVTRFCNLEIHLLLCFDIWNNGEISLSLIEITVINPQSRRGRVQISPKSQFSLCPWLTQLPRQFNFTIKVAISCVGIFVCKPTCQIIETFANTVKFLHSQFTLYLPFCVTLIPTWWVGMIIQWSPNTMMIITTSSRNVYANFYSIFLARRGINSALIIVPWILNLFVHFDFVLFSFIHEWFPSPPWSHDKLLIEIAPYTARRERVLLSACTHIYHDELSAQLSLEPTFGVTL